MRPCVLVQLGAEVEHLDLVGDVEERRRLVEQQDRRLLRERHRQPDALALAAGQLVDDPLGQVVRVAVERAPARRARPRATTGAAAAGAGSGPRATRSATVMPSGAIGVCGSSPSSPRDLLRGERADPLAVEQHLPLRGLSMRDSARSSVDLPQAFGPTITVKEPSGIVDVEVAATTAAGRRRASGARRAARGAVGHAIAHRRPRSIRGTAARRGTARRRARSRRRRAVGRATGAARRGRRSTSSAAHQRARRDPGDGVRVRRRASWGAASATKATGPAAATPPAVSATRDREQAGASARRPRRAPAPRRRPSRASAAAGRAAATSGSSTASATATGTTCSQPRPLRLPASQRAASIASSRRARVIR